MRFGSPLKNALPQNPEPGVVSITYSVARGIRLECAAKVQNFLAEILEIQAHFLQVQLFSLGAGFR
ncbi:hypothetical protein [Rufibacter sp. LB8]|uniref:hypothetical protein n=1 Tax=Rufibacter sp. LB8 TaxID=2777781 RepID=UPI00178C7858|nr:hypothetical protein [Rufibacter sp. LB8]